MIRLVESIRRSEKSGGALAVWVIVSVGPSALHRRSRGAIGEAPKGHLEPSRARQAGSRVSPERLEQMGFATG